MAIQDKTRNIPSLDGLRAVSILLVIVAHTNIHFPDWIRSWFPFLVLAHTGVSIFFVISGFLITSLLLKELDSTGAIRLKRFYVRRAFRIFPPYYVYLAIIAALSVGGIVATPLRAILVAAIYGTDYYWGPGSGWSTLQHTWSLCVEEQFYLLWPATLHFLERRTVIRLAIALILTAPVLRVATYFLLAPPHRAMVGRMFHSSVDTIMFGCLMAMVWRSERFQRLVRNWVKPWPVAVAVLLLVTLDPWCDRHLGGGFNLIVGMTLDGICICTIMIFVVKRPESLAGRMLNWRWVRHIGVISYSLYLWQSVFCAEGGRFFPLNLVALVVCAELSYWVVERPSLRVRDRLGSAA